MHSCTFDSPRCDRCLRTRRVRKRQYALRERAVALGWPIERIHTIDNDLGISGARADNRDGFQHLVSEVALGHAGIVLGLEVSRLARNNADWHRLLELAALAQTLILDEDGIYDPAHFNDRLLLGLKGTMSEAELHVLKARVARRHAQQSTSRRTGDGVCRSAWSYDALPAPWRWIRISRSKTGRADGLRHVPRSPLRDRGRTSLRCARVCSFPRRIRRGIGKGELLWGTLDHSRVIQILHNPRYAGAFVYGRYRDVPTARA